MVKRLRLGLLGAGMVGRAHAHAFGLLRASFHPPVAEVELAVVADPNGALAREAQARYGFGRIAATWEEVAAADDVDVACVALPNHQHRAAVEALLGRGKHVLCEKPLGLNPAEARAMLGAARRAGVVHGVGFSQRRAPAVAAVQRAVARGDLGDLRHFSGRYFTDYAASPETPFTWRYQRDLAGAGALADIGSHMIDMARFVLGEIESVEGALLETFIKERPVPAGPMTGHDRGPTTGEMRPVENDDVAAFTARFRSGVVGQFHVSRIAAGYRNSPAFELVGSRGAAMVDLERPGELHYFDATREDDLSGFRRVVTGPRHPYFGQVVSLPVAGVGHGYGETYLAQAHDFVRAVVGEADGFRPDFADGYAAALVDEAVQRAAEQGRRVRIDEVDAEAALLSS
jgi:predicted dehydrogenase